MRLLVVFLVLLNAVCLCNRAKKFRQLLSWMDDLPPSPKLYQVKFHNSDSTNITLRAYYDFPAGTTVFAMPVRQELQSHRSSRLSSAVEDELSRRDIDITSDQLWPQLFMIAVLLEEYTKGEHSDFYRYIEVLPRDFSNMPLDPNFSPDLLEYVNSQMMWHGPLSAERKRYDLYETLILGAIRNSRLLSKHKPFTSLTKSDVQWAYHCVRSRTFLQEMFAGEAAGGGDDGEDGVFVAMTPLIDMLNHADEPNCDVTRSTYEGEMYAAVKTIRDVEKGEELTIQYVEPDELRVFLAYGFGVQPSAVPWAVHKVQYAHALIDCRVTPMPLRNSMPPSKRSSR